MPTEETIPAVAATRFKAGSPERQIVSQPPPIEQQWSATQPGSLTPTMEKWSLASRLPISPITKNLPPADAGIISRLPQQVINEVKQTTPVPQANIADEGATPIYKPYSVKMTAKDAKGLRDYTLNNLHSGMNMADATRKAITDRFGDSPSLEPNIVTNTPGTPESIFHGSWRDRVIPAVPPVLGTNYFRISRGDTSSNDGVEGEDVANKPVKFQPPNPIPDAPVDKASRKVNQKYVLPNGKIGQWNGKGWQLVKE
jgi:hypothetical protein